MFAAITSQIDAVTTGLLGVGAAAGLLSVVILGFINLWSPMDPRMGQMVKGGLMKVVLTLALFGAAAGGSAIMRLS